ncbi:MAG TPA: hypothetical protein VKS01_02425 [Bryobacteraceae bacterium]|nr:hypothetical protein [Bryobacteraceae bacterium]
MPLNDDVFRGLRWGAILLAGLAIGVLGYRLWMEPPSTKPANSAPVAEPARPVPAAPEPKIRSVAPPDPALEQRPVPSPPPPVNGKASR